MEERVVTISNRLGLHARAAARLVQCAAKFASTVEIQRQDSGQSADGKSILSVLLLAASAGTTLLIKLEGADEQAAADALVELIERKFGEGVSDGLY
jgi:phosphocarrier protein HPr